MKNDEVIEIFKWTLLNRGLWDSNYSFTFDEDIEVFYDADHEIEYQIRDYSNGDFHEILMRFCDDKTHSYIELYLEDFENDPYEMIYYALEEGIEILEKVTLRNMEKNIK